MSGNAQRSLQRNPTSNVSVAVQQMNDTTMAEEGEDLDSELLQLVLNKQVECFSYLHSHIEYRYTHILLRSHCSVCWVVVGFIACLVRIKKLLHLKSAIYHFHQLLGILNIATGVWVLVRNSS